MSLAYSWNRVRTDKEAEGDVVEEAQRRCGRGPAPGKQRGIEPRPLRLLKGDRRGDRLQDRLLPLEQSSFRLGPSASSQTGGSGPLPGRLLPDLIDCAEHGTHVRDPDLVVSSLDFYEVTTPADIQGTGELSTDQPLVPLARRRTGV
jgi:hypothetical protein